ncbi:proton-conducting transporter membrane subunit [Paracoccus sp. (in: a-proteobacteria)]|uniref:proton-conducting transporter transmembrane domain-containing protein n=1 Tax=Paracoccus sp. TaxID=267 RepID=UPI003A4C6E00
MLFLGAGSVIHAMHHEQDMRNYGGLRKKIPLTFWAMMIGTLAITGVGIPLTHIGFAGFLSKDAIIESAYAAGSNYAFWMLVIAACFTSFYSWRLIFLTFYGKPRGDHHAHDHAHESPPVMTIPLGILAIGAIFAGMVWYGPFFGDHNKFTSYFHIAGAHEVVEGEAAVEHATAEAPVATTDQVARCRGRGRSGGRGRARSSCRAGRWCDLYPSRQPHHGRSAPRTGLGQSVALRRHVAGVDHRVDLLYRQPLSAGAAGCAATGALSVPAQQMVLRRALRLHLRPAREMAWPCPVEGRRRRRHRRHHQRGGSGD